jgi:hypothetical protein
VACAEINCLFTPQLIQFKACCLVPPTRCHLCCLGNSSTSLPLNLRFEPAHDGFRRAAREKLTDTFQSTSLLHIYGTEGISTTTVNMYILKLMKAD